MPVPDFNKLNARVDSLRGELLRVLSDLVRTPTVNIPPRGAEKKGQELLAAEFRKMGFEPDLYDIGQIQAMHVKDCVEPLLYALKKDSDANVRRAAAEVPCALAVVPYTARAAQNATSFARADGGPPA